jgi:DNA-binding beta-propeller fold protein YncE
VSIQPRLRPVLLPVLALIAATLAALALTAASASAAPYKYEAAASEELSKTVPGGAFENPQDLTFDGAGDLFLLQGGGSIDKFDSSNVFQAQFSASALNNGFARSIAVDDTTGDLYAGALGVGGSELTELVVLSSSGATLSQWTGANTPAGTFGVGDCCRLFTAVDNSTSPSKGDVYVVTSNGGGEVDVIEPLANGEEGKFVRHLEAPAGFEFHGNEGIAVNDSSGPEAGEIYVVDQGHKLIDRFSPTGELEAQIKGPSPSEPFEGPTAVAVDSATGDVFVIDGAKVVDKFNAAGELLTKITETGLNEPFGKPVGIAVQQTGPHAGELYVADSKKKAIDVFAEEQPAAPLIESAGVQKLSEHTATFAGEVNPRGAATAYRFEYGRCTTSITCEGSPYEASVPTPDGTLTAEDFTAHATAPVTVQGLTAATTYHFRFVAHNVHGEVAGEERVFTTQGAGGTFALPDNRAWELVSPPDKHGASLSKLRELGVIQAAADGSAIGYLGNAPTEAQPAGGTNDVQVLSTRTTSGWSSRDIATPHEAATGDSPGTAPEHLFFSEDLSTSIVQPLGLFNPALSVEASEQTPYLQALGGCSSSCFHPLVTGKTGFSNVPAGTAFGEELECKENNGINSNARSVCGPQFQGATRDASHVVLRSAAPLIAGVPRNELYEWAGGHLSLVSVLAANEAGEELPAPTGAELDSQPLLGAKFDVGPGATARRAISVDGVRIFWESGAKLYLRDTAKGKSLQIDAPEAGCAECEGEGGAGRFQIASAKGSRVYFTDTHHLTKDAGAKTGETGKSEPDLYECRIGEESSGKLSCALTDLTPKEGGESANVQGGVLGASEDGSSIYFVADGTLAGSGARRGTCVNNGETPQAPGTGCNLYERRDGQGTRLVAPLSGGDAKVWSQDAEHRPARVSPNGQYLALMSERPLTGYDNTDAVSGKPDAEVFLYDSTGAGQLSCASCDPSGARPVGVEYQKLEAGASEALPAVRGEWESTGWVAALLPHTSAFGFNEPGYQADYLNNSGRLFFNALDALVPQDTNGTGDVYQFEPAGIGTCATAAGCVGLISSGTSSEASAFLDASESGNDVFFLTASRLTSADVDSRSDVYDAHVCSTQSPCIQPPASPTPPCTTEASCKPSPAPQPSIFGAPASATFEGPGNLKPAAPPPPKHRTAAQIRAEHLKKALKACRKDKRRAKRQACERQARKRYGPAKKATKSSSTRTANNKRRAK